MGTVRWRKRVLFVPLLAVPILMVVGALWLLRDTRSAAEWLAEIEAARAIPDSENAAILYDSLFQDPNAGFPLDHLPESVGREDFDRLAREPWRRQDFPELAAWIEKNRQTIDRLLEVSQCRECRFPINIDIPDTSLVHRGLRMRQWMLLLSAAANLDIAERRIHATVTEWRCLVAMANHLYQQPNLGDHFLGMGTEGLALASMAWFIATGNPTESHLQQIESIPLTTGDVWRERLTMIRTIEYLKDRHAVKEIGWRERLRHPIQYLRLRRDITREVHAAMNPPQDRSFGLDEYRYRRLVATARGIRILVALRRGHDSTGRWPQSLDDVRASLPGEVLTDPLNGGSFMYRQASDTFVLYSRGRNNIDESGGRESNLADDLPIWPTRERHVEPKSGDGKLSEETLKMLEQAHGREYVQRYLRNDPNDE